MPFSPTQLLAQYGYLAVFAGSVIEGETILLLAGFAAHQGYLSFPLAVFWGFAAGLAADQAFFHLGRCRGPWLVRRFPSVGGHVRRVDGLVARYRSLVVLMLRFLYGLRVAGPAVIGMSEIGAWRFAALDALGALTWSLVMCGAGYLFGGALNAALDDLKRYEEAALVLLACAGAGVWLWRRRREQGRKPKDEAGGPAGEEK